jgi:hypothetical protein
MKKTNWDDLIVGEIPLTGSVQIDVNFLVNNWDDKCWLAEWRMGKDDDFRFIRYKQIGRDIATHKFSITREQAEEVINRLALESEQGALKSGHSWRKPGVTEITLLNKYKKI